MIALSPAEEWDYQLRADRKRTPDPDEPGKFRESIDETKPVFRLGSLTPQEEAFIENETVALIDGSQRVQIGTIKLETLRRGLRGWRNMRDRDGNEVPFKSNGSPNRPSEESIGAIPLRLRAELANAITERNTMTGLEQDSPEPSLT